MAEKKLSTEPAPLALARSLLLRRNRILLGSVVPAALTRALLAFLCCSLFFFRWFRLNVLFIG